MQTVDASTFSNEQTDKLLTQRNQFTTAATRKRSSQINFLFIGFNIFCVFDLVYNILNNCLIE